MSTGRLAGRVAIVTGGASGIGRATVLRLCGEGARIVVVDINDEAGAAVRVRLTTPALAAVYGPAWLSAKSPSTDAVLMIAPPVSCRSICGMAYRMP